MACEICGTESGGAPGAGTPCVRCGFPAVGAEPAGLLAEAAGLVRDGEVDRAIRKVQQAAKAAPEAWLPRVRLAVLYERKGLAGEEPLLRLADREYAEAIRLAPQEREPHVARLGLSARLGRLPLLRDEYKRRRDELPFAADCLRIIDALEGTVMTARPAGDLRFPNTPPRLLLLAGGVALLLGLALLSVVTWGSVNDEGMSITAQPGLWVSIVLLTGAAVLLLEGWRGQRAKELT